MSASGFEPASARLTPGAPAAALLAAASGFLVWVALSLAGSRASNGAFLVREAWDTPLYFSLGLPILAAVAAIAGYVAPGRVWRWPLWMAIGQAVAMVLVRPMGTDLALVPIALVFVGLPLVLLLTVPALVGGMIALRRFTAGLLL